MGPKTAYSTMRTEAINTMITDPSACVATASMARGPNFRIIPLTSGIAAGQEAARDAGAAIVAVLDWAEKKFADIGKKGGRRRGIGSPDAKPLALARVSFYSGNVPSSASAFVAAAFVGAGGSCPFLFHEGRVLALRAGRARGPVPEGLVAVRIAVAGEELLLFRHLSMICPCLHLGQTTGFPSGSITVFSMF